MKWREGCGLVGIKMDGKKTCMRGEVVSELA